MAKKKLGKIEKPEASKFKGKKKLYLVPLLFSWPGAPEEYIKKLNSYWQQVAEQLANLESKMGRVSRIYHEAITETGKEGLKALKRLSPASFQIVSDKRHNGAKFELVEDRELIEQSLDWERLLFTGFVSQKVARIVSDFFLEASRNRYQHIAQRIAKTLKDNEAAVLFIREGHLVQFPKDLEVFSIAPPVLDEIHRWLRERPTAQKKDETKKGSD